MRSERVHVLRIVFCHENGTMNIGGRVFLIQARVENEENGDHPLILGKDCRHGYAEQHPNELKMVNSENEPKRFSVGE